MIKSEEITKAASIPNDLIHQLKGTVNITVSKIAEQFKSYELLDKILYHTLFIDSKLYLHVNQEESQVDKGLLYINYTSMISVEIDFKNETYTIYKKKYYNGSFYDNKLLFSRLLSIKSLEYVFFYLKAVINQKTLIKLTSKTCLRHKFLK